MARGGDRCLATGPACLLLGTAARWDDGCRLWPPSERLRENLSHVILHVGFLVRAWPIAIRPSPAKAGVAHSAGLLLAAAWLGVGGVGGRGGEIESSLLSSESVCIALNNLHTNSSAQSRATFCDDVHRPHSPTTITARYITYLPLPHSFETLRRGDHRRPSRHSRRNRHLDNRRPDTTRRPHQRRPSPPSLPTFPRPYHCAKLGSLHTRPRSDTNCNRIIRIAYNPAPDHSPSPALGPHSCPHARYPATRSYPFRPGASSFSSYDLASMSFVETARTVAGYLNPSLPFPFNYVSSSCPLPPRCRTDETCTFEGSSLTTMTQIPLFFRLLSVLLAAPFLVFIALDLIAYGEHARQALLTPPAIARTLHLSMSQLRVPRSPPSVPRELVADDKDDDDFDSPIVDGLESSSGSPVARTRKLEEGGKGQAASGPSLASRLILPISSLVVVLAIFLQLTSSTNNVKNSTRLAALNSEAPPYALILTAHPDDEVMFFAPTILNLVATGWSILGVCLSSGACYGD